jgi:hypothetical protein
MHGQTLAIMRVQRHLVRTLFTSPIHEDNTPEMLVTIDA